MSKMTMFAGVLALWLLHSALSFAQMSMKVSPLYKLDPEKQLWKRGFQCVLGSDETGNGCIAGPVVVATCGLIREGKKIEPISGVKDSKLLSVEEIKRIYDIVVDNPDIYVWNTVLATQEEIDEADVPTATKEALRKSIENLVQLHDLPGETTYSIVDGHKTPKLTIQMKCRPWVKGDSQVYTVALASIMAKHTHTQIVKEMHEQYPDYGFDENRGYPSRDHIVAIHTHGPCAIHRKSSKPLKGR
jgi:ribonuclease HII